MSVFFRIVVQPFTKTIIKFMENSCAGKPLSKQVILRKNVKPRLQLNVMSYRDCLCPIMGFQTAFKDGKPIKMKYLIPEKKCITDSRGYDRYVPDYDKLYWTEYLDIGKNIEKIG